MEAIDNLSRYELQLRATAALELKQRNLKQREDEKTVYGIVSAEGELLRCWQDTTDKFDYEEVDKPPDIEIPLAFERAVLTKALIILIEGGRGSAKSETVSGIMACRVKDYGYKIGAFREFQNSIEDSVHSIIKKKITTLALPGFSTTDTKIDHDNSGGFRYRGLSRNTTGVKSMDGFNGFWVEEAETASAESIELIEPTLREEGAQIWYTLNRGSSADAISVEHLAPYEDALARDGYYEDETILVIHVHYTDNPWFPDNLEIKRKKNKLSWSAARYAHVWDGAYYDEVENSIIKAEWFDAAIDAHKIERLKKVFEPHGAKVATHDPSGTGDDDKSYVLTHGSIVLKVLSKATGEIDKGCDWATGMAIKDGVDRFIWDEDGMGGGLVRQVSIAFEGKQIKYYGFRGSLSGKAQDNAKKKYLPNDLDDNAGSKPKSYAETFLNNRSQHSISLRNKFYNTYRCVVLNEYIDPSDMISIDSAGVEKMATLRSEVCRVPSVENNRGLIQIMSKKDMAALGLISPNMFDGLMMSEFIPKTKVEDQDITIPSGPSYG